MNYEADIKKLKRSEIAGKVICYNCMIESNHLTDNCPNLQQYGYFAMKSMKNYIYSTTSQDKIIGEQLLHLYPLCLHALDKLKHIHNII